VPGQAFDHPDVIGAKHLVEAGGELGISVADKELHGPAALCEIGDEVAGKLGDEGPGGNAHASPRTVLLAEADDEPDELVAQTAADRAHVAGATSATCAWPLRGAIATRSLG